MSKYDKSSTDFTYIEKEIGNEAPSPTPPEPNPPQSKSRLPAWVTTYCNRRISPIFILGIASGLPYALVAGTLQAWAGVENVSIQSVGWLSLVGAAYGFKFLWAPLIDWICPPLGRRKGWILLCQVLMAIILFILGFLSPGHQLEAVAVAAALVGFLSATQDIAINAYMREKPHESELAASATANVLGWRIGYYISAPIALILAGEYFGFDVTYRIMGIIMAVLALLTLLFIREPLVQNKPRSFTESVVGPFKDFFVRYRGSGLVTFALLVLIYKLGEQFTTALQTYFLTTAGGFTVTQIGLVSKGVGIIMGIIGGLLGGFVMNAIGVWRSLFYFGILMAVTSLGYFFVALNPGNLTIMAIAISLEHLTAGIVISAYVAFLMFLCNKEFTGMQYALLSAFSVLGTYIAGPVTAVLIKDLHMPWPEFFIFAACMSIPGLALMWFKRDLVISLEKAQKADDAARDQALSKNKA